MRDTCRQQTPSMARAPRTTQTVSQHGPSPLSKVPVPWSIAHMLRRPYWPSKSPNVSQYSTLSCFRKSTWRTCVQSRRHFRTYSTSTPEASWCIKRRILHRLSCRLLADTCLRFAGPFCPWSIDCTNRSFSRFWLFPMKMPLPLSWSFCSSTHRRRSR